MNVTVVGAGYVGLVTGVCLASRGHRVTCVDINADTVRRINAGDPHIYEPGLAELLASSLGNGRFSATTDLAAAVASSAATMIAVGTPSTAEGIDLTAVRGAASAIGEQLRGRADYHVVIVKSTVVPGTTEGPVREALEAASGRPVGEFGLCMTPEFLREGHAVADLLAPDRIVIGASDQRAYEATAALYASFDCPVLNTTIPNAELIKYASNGLLALVVSYCNELAGLCEAIPHTDIDVVMDGVHLDRRLTSRVEGRTCQSGLVSYLRAGSGFGGSCLPKDVTALRMSARQHGVDTPVLDAAMRVNAERPDRVADLIERALGGLRGRRLGLIGLTFKAGTDDLRDSPALALLDRLVRRGATVRAYDPLVPTAGAELAADVCARPEDVFADAEGAVIATALPELKRWDWTALGARMRTRTVFDARNALRGVTLPAGFTYVPIGRVTPFRGA